MLYAKNLLKKSAQINADFFFLRTFADINTENLCLFWMLHNNLEFFYSVLFTV